MTGHTNTRTQFRTDFRTSQNCNWCGNFDWFRIDVSALSQISNWCGKFRTTVMTILQLYRSAPHSSAS